MFSQFCGMRCLQPSLRTTPAREERCDQSHVGGAAGSPGELMGVSLTKEHSLRWRKWRSHTVRRDHVLSGFPLNTEDHDLPAWIHFVQLHNKAGDGVPERNEPGKSPVEDDNAAGIWRRRSRLSQRRRWWSQRPEFRRIRQKIRRVPAVGCQHARSRKHVRHGLRSAPGIMSDWFLRSLYDRTCESYAHDSMDCAQRGRAVQNGMLVAASIVRAASLDNHGLPAPSAWFRSCHRWPPHRGTSSTGGSGSTTLLRRSIPSRKLEGPSACRPPV